MRISNKLQKRSHGLYIANVAAASLAALILPLSVGAQTPYHDPQGRFDFKIPDGWKVTEDKENDQVIVSNGAANAVIFVMKQKPSKPKTAQDMVDLTAKMYQEQCPTLRIRQNKAAVLDGLPGVYGLFTCSDPQSPSVAEEYAAITTNGAMVAFSTASRLVNFYANLPVLDGIRSSLHVAGEKVAATRANTTESLAMNELGKACAAGVFAQQDECARRMGILEGQEGKERHDPAEPVTGTEYRDPTGRFTLRVPKGWSATPNGDNGILGVQLRSGADWIKVKPADPAGSASEVVLREDRLIAEETHSDIKPPFSPIGLMQVFGNGLEVTYDSFGSHEQEGFVQGYVGGVGDISGTDHNFLLVVTYINGTDEDKAAGLFLSVARSIHLAGH